MADFSVEGRQKERDELNAKVEAWISAGGVIQKLEPWQMKGAICPKRRAELEERRKKKRKTVDGIPVGMMRLEDLARKLKTTLGNVRSLRTEGMLPPHAMKGARGIVYWDWPIVEKHLRLLFPEEMAGDDGLSQIESQIYMNVSKDKLRAMRQREYAPTPRRLLRKCAQGWLKSELDEWLKRYNEGAIPCRADADPHIKTI